MSLTLQMLCVVAASIVLAWAVAWKPWRWRPKEMPICRPDYHWWTVSAGRDEAYGAWLKIGPVILCWFDWKGRREFELHTNNRLLRSSM